MRFCDSKGLESGNLSSGKPQGGLQRVFGGKMGGGRMAFQLGQGLQVFVC